MAVALRGTPTSGTVDVLAIFGPTLPAGTQTGDLLLVMVGMATNTAFAAPSGWLRSSNFSAGTNHCACVFYATYFPGLNFSWGNGNYVSTWICSAAYETTGGTIGVDFMTGGTNAVSNTTVGTATITSSHNIAGNYVWCAYSWTGTGVLIGAAGLTIDGQTTPANGIGVAQAHGDATLAANGTNTAWATTVSVITNRKVNLVAHLYAAGVPSGPIGSLADPLQSTGVLDTSKWAYYGNGASMTPNALQLVPIGTANDYGGIVSNGTFNATGKYAYVRVFSRLVTSGGTVLGVRLEVDSANWVEFGQVTSQLQARKTIAGVTTIINAALTWPASPYIDRRYLRIHESGGVLFFSYSDVPWINAWYVYRRLLNPFAVTAMKVRLNGGLSATNASPGVGLLNGFNVATGVHGYAQGVALAAGVPESSPPPIPLTAVSWVGDDHFVMSTAGPLVKWDGDKFQPSGGAGSQVVWEDDVFKVSA